MRSARFPLQGCGDCGCSGLDDCGCGCSGVGCGCAGTPVLAVSGLGCGCGSTSGMEGLGGKFDSPAPNPYNSLSGLTPLQNAKVTFLRGLQIPNVVRAVGILGPAAPEVSYQDVLDLNLLKIARAQFAPQGLARSVILFALYQTGALIEKLPFAYRMANAGVPGAAALVDRAVYLAELGTSSVRNALDLTQTVQTATSGLGLDTSYVTAAVISAAAYFIGGPVLLVAALPPLVYYLHSVVDVQAEIDARCAQQLTLTGVRCRPEDIARYHDQITAENRSVLDDIGARVAEGAGSAISSVLKYALIGGGVLIAGGVAYAYIQYRLGRAVLGSSTGRKLIGAAVGGPMGAALVSNRKRSSRRRVSRRRSSRSRR
jgi:hypothetical protein